MRLSRSMVAFSPATMSPSLSTVLARMPKWGVMARARAGSRAGSRAGAGASYRDRARARTRGTARARVGLVMRLGLQLG